MLLSENYNIEMIKFKRVLMGAFDMTDLGDMVYFMGMEFMHTTKGIIVHQLKYEVKILKRFELMDCKFEVTFAETCHKLDVDVDVEYVDATTFKKLVGSLRYSCNTRSVICCVVGMLSIFMKRPKWSHYQDTVRVLR